MPRPSTGYRNAAGLPVPGATDIIKRYMDRTRLMYWAFNRGKEGHARLYDDTALDIGSAVHMMAELNLKDRPQSDIDFYASTTLTDREALAKANTCYEAFRAWREQFHVRPHIQEISLVSEQLQFGGTLDTVAVINNGLGLLELKTSSEVYEDHLLQLAAYGILWAETHPRDTLEQGYHLILLPKDGSKPTHRQFTDAQLHPFRQKFWLYRKAFALDGACTDPAILKGNVPKPSRKPKAPPKSPASMAELLRSYGHVRAA